MLQQWQAVGNTVFDLTSPSFEPQTSRSRYERITSRPTNFRNYLVATIATVICSNFYRKSRICYC